MTTLGISGPIIGHTAAGFAGGTDVVEIPTDPALHVADASAPFSLEAWVNRTAGDAIVNAHNEWELGFDSTGHPRFGSWSVYVTDASTLSAGWHHLVGVFDGTTMHLYVDGNEVASGAPGTIRGPEEGKVRIGRKQSSFTGGLAAVAIYGSALGADRILAHFAAASDAGVPSGGARLHGVHATTSLEVGRLMVGNTFGWDLDPWEEGKGWGV